MSSYKDLIVWQKSIDICEMLYTVTNGFPNSEIYGITSQIRRCAVSIPSNIAEDQRRGSRKENIQFLRVAYGSGAELETQLILSQKIGYLSSKDYVMLSSKLDEVMKMLNRLISVLVKS